MKYMLYVSFFLALISCKNNHNASNKEILNYYISDANNYSKVNIDTYSDSTKKAEMLISERKLNFGKIKKSETDSMLINFEIKNIGNKPLIIAKCDVSCGICLSVKFSKEPILPNQKSIIKVTIKPENQSGTFSKTIFVKSNAINDVELIRIIGEII